MLLADNDRRFRLLQWKLATFVLTAIAGAAAAILFFAHKQGYFEAKTPLSFVSDTGNELRQGMAVKFSGFKIGAVNELKLDDRGRVRVHILVEDRYLKWIKTDSIGRVARDGPIGDSYIDVGLGDPRLPPVDPNTQLEFIPAKTFDDLIREVRDRAVPVFNEVETLIKRFSDPQGDLNQTLHNVRKLSGDLHDTRQKLDQLLVSVNQLSSEQVPDTLAATRAALERADRTLSLVENQLPQLLQRTEQTLANVQATTDGMKKVVEQAGPDAVELVKDGRELARKGNETVDAVTGAWPLNKIIPPPPSTPPRSDSQGVTP